MGAKLCLIAGCLNVTSGGPRCPLHEAEHQRARNARRGADRKPNAAYRGLSLVGEVCWCCGTREDLTRHHRYPLAHRTADGWRWREDGTSSPLDVVIPLCRRCNSSIGTRRMEGLACPLHGGVILR